MKSGGMGLTFLLVGLLLLAASNTALAAESWVTDPATGAKIGWVSEEYTLSAASWSGPIVDGKAEGKGTLAVTARGKDSKDIHGLGEVEFVAGLLDGKASLKWAHGDSYDGFYIKGLKSGKGTYTFSNGSIFEGDWENGACNGYGIMKDSTGKIVHDGQWKNGKPVIMLKTDKVLGIPWGASEDDAARILSQRPNTRCQVFVKNGAGKTKGCYSTFNDEGVFVQTGFYQEKMYYVWIFAFSGEDQVMDKFISYKQGLTERYGAPMSEKGKYLDSQVNWDLGSGYNAQLTVRKNTLSPYPLWPESQQLFSRPFTVAVLYYHSDTLAFVNKAQGKTAAKEF